ncbi:adenine nucleotide alpha hydrolase [Budvicia diplopodorum]|uniref:adenine nucleotide alpha hydrolase n=1 Tax=Budvicia diplopodorum TaxID=1119056 RepID=UPI001357BB65|nr:adenine nucleotide alpha hydrolase [Budvicia diplopodorum]
MNSNDRARSALQRLEDWLMSIGQCTVAVSGGIDSMLMAYVAHRALGDSALMVHATSAAVPQADGLRVEEYARRYQWNFKRVVTGEMDQENYQKNPVNRCYYCKSSLYLNLRHLDHGQTVSGTNLDDLGDYRPGLIAAQEQNIRHPYIECQIDKNTIREMAALLGLTDLQDLPASPCLASRVETGIRILPGQLDLIDRVERLVRSQIVGETIRFRIRQSAMVLELDDRVLTQLTPCYLDELSQKIETMAKESGLNAPLSISAYQRGSAFVGHKEPVNYVRA